MVQVEVWGHSGFCQARRVEWEGRGVDLGAGGKPATDTSVKNWWGRHKILGHKSCLEPQTKKTDSTP